MLDRITEKYIQLNSLGEQGGFVIFGGNNDYEIPLCELKQAFEIDENIYNRSIPHLSVTDAKKIYMSCVSSLNPDVVMLHIGEEDLDWFLSNSTEFESKYRDLIAAIKQNNKCNIVIVSLKNYLNDSRIEALNKHLKYLAESEQCEYADISRKKVWDPKKIKNIVSFVRSIGFVKPLEIKRPTYDMVNMLFCYNCMR